MRKYIIGLLCALIAPPLAIIATPGLAAAYDAPRLANAAAYTASVNYGPYSTNTYNCLVYWNVSIINQEPAGLALKPHLINVDRAMAATNVCGGPTPTATSTAEANPDVADPTGQVRAHDSGWCFSGPYSATYNVDEIVGSANLQSNWYSGYCYVGTNQGYPDCYQGGLAIDVSVSIQYCGSVRNDSPWFETDRMQWTLTIQVFIFSKSFGFWNWANNWGNGAQQLGCHVGYSYGCNG